MSKTFVRSKGTSTTRSEGLSYSSFKSALRRPYEHGIRHDHEEQQTKWNKNEDWPLWAEPVARESEFGTSRLRLGIQSGCPFRHLQRAGTKPVLSGLHCPAKKKWMRQIKHCIPTERGGHG
jgi:hypothetical protein